MNDGSPTKMIALKKYFKDNTDKKFEKQNEGDLLYAPDQYKIIKEKYGEKIRVMNSVE